LRVIQECEKCGNPLEIETNPAPMQGKDEIAKEAPYHRQYPN